MFNKEIESISTAAAVLLLVLGGCGKGGQEGTQDADEDEVQGNLPPVDIANVPKGTVDFSQFYSIEPLEVTPSVQAYELPLTPTGILNYDAFSGQITLSTEAEDMLMANGFVVIRNPLYADEADIQSAYLSLKMRDLPIFITTDSLLHLYHIQFDETLRVVEEREFFADLWDMSRTLLDDMVEKYSSASGDLREAAGLAAGFYAVALSLLEPDETQVCVGDAYRCNNWETTFTEAELEAFAFEAPSFLDEAFTQELENIESRAGFVQSALFHYLEDFTQYAPRGHYTRSEKLKNYFMALMWYGRMTFLLKSDLILAQDRDHEALVQTMAAALMASAFAENDPVREKWDRIYSVTSFYVGFSDDLSFYQYLEAMNDVFGGTFDPEALDPDAAGLLKARLAEFSAPRINGGTGMCDITPPYTPDQADECLEAQKGLRFMGQRFILDSYFFTGLTSLSYTGSGEPFSLAQCLDPQRGFPRGLDVMALLGSARALSILESLGDTDYEFYYETFDAFADEIGAFDEKQWSRNAYLSWLYALRSLLDVFEEGYPTFMRSEAWLDKELVAALASWSELRHDTILYAKQSYSGDVTAEPAQPAAATGYVEPAAEFYNNLLALTQMTRMGLDSMNVLDSTSRARFSTLESILVRVRDIAVTELEGNPLRETDIDFISNFADALRGVLADVGDESLKTTLVADVHTEMCTGQVVEEATGAIKLIVVAYRVPEGHIVVGAGPVFSYYEFKHPTTDRLTDEAWRDLLQTSPPAEPEWIDTFAAP